MGKIYTFGFGLDSGEVRQKTTKKNGKKNPRKERTKSLSYNPALQRFKGHSRDKTKKKRI